MSDDYPATLNLTAITGATKDVLLTWTEAGELVDLTDWTALLQVRAAPGAMVLIELTDQDGITLGGTAGTILAHFTASDTDLPKGSYRYDLRLTNADQDIVMYLVEGRFRVDSPITVDVLP